MFSAPGREEKEKAAGGQSQGGEGSGTARQNWSGWALAGLVPGGDTRRNRTAGPAVLHASPQAGEHSQRLEEQVFTLSVQTRGPRCPRFADAPRPRRGSQGHPRGGPLGPPAHKGRATAAAPPAHRFLFADGHARRWRANHTETCASE